MISPVLVPYLTDLEKRINSNEEERLEQEWGNFIQGRHPEPIFCPKRNKFSQPEIHWPVVPVNVALVNYDAMVLQQFGYASDALASGSGLLLHARCNFGSSILPSLFGVQNFIMDESYNTLPTSIPLNDTWAIEDLVARGIPALSSGWGEQVFEMGERYAEIKRTFPKIGRYLTIFHPDAQGPLDICEVIWGSNLFYALIDRPGLVHALLDLICRTYIKFLNAWDEIIPFKPDANVHWGFLHRGKIMLRDDSAMNLSPSMFREFVQPYDQRLLDAFNGGAVHFCGHGDHFISSMTEMHGVYAINLSQPELNRMEVIFQNTLDKGIPLLGLKHEAAEKALAAGRCLHSLVQV
jgi:hypothetical protein